tara:strand:+ start:203 stop:697 length:495 start_codon:yes stop_codon:yes gene_type:complete
MGTLNHSDTVAYFAEHAQALAEGGADVMWIETMSSIEELAAAAEAARATGLPICVTLTFDTARRSMMGVTIIDGCCGTTPEHIAAMVNAFDSTPRRALDTEGMTGALGTPWAALAETEASGGGEKRREHRRKGSATPEALDRACRTEPNKKAAPRAAFASQQCN